MVYNFCDKKASCSGIKNENMSDHRKPRDDQQKNYTNELLENLRKENYNHFSIDSIWGADLANMQLISKFNKGIHFYYAILNFIANMLGLFL